MYCFLDYISYIIRDRSLTMGWGATKPFAHPPPPLSIQGQTFCVPLFKGGNCLWPPAPISMAKTSNYRIKTSQNLFFLCLLPPPFGMAKTCSAPHFCRGKTSLAPPPYRVVPLLVISDQSLTHVRAEHGMFAVYFTKAPARMSCVTRIEKITIPHFHFGNNVRPPTHIYICRSHFRKKRQFQCVVNWRCVCCVCVACSFVCVHVSVCVCLWDSMSVSASVSVSVCM